MISRCEMERTISSTEKLFFSVRRATATLEFMEMQREGSCSDHGSQQSSFTCYVHGRAFTKPALLIEVQRRNWWATQGEPSWALKHTPQGRDWCLPVSAWGNASCSGSVLSEVLWDWRELRIFFPFFCKSVHWEALDGIWHCLIFHVFIKLWPHRGSVGKLDARTRSGLESVCSQDTLWLSAFLSS